MLTQLQNKEKKLAVIGLGYVGLPIALEFARRFSVIGFDINPQRVAMLKERKDPSNELDASAFDGCDIQFTHALDDLKSAQFFVVAVPTPIDEHKNPDLKPLIGASRTVGKMLKPGDYVVYESTVYPGCTEEDCIPILEQESGLTFRNDFKVGYSPERINPGDKEHTLTRITKVVSGCDAESLEVIAGVYGSIITAGIHKAASIQVAEAAKIIENTQRDINIALMNELSLIFNKMNINTYDVLEAAGTKWNFLKFTPGLVGGHCIGVDPYYLTYKASEIGYHSKVILSGRLINDSMGAHIAKQCITRLIQADKNIRSSRILIMGATFKENVTDIRNSKVVDILEELKTYMVNIDVVDPHASSEELQHEYGFGLAEAPSGKYDAIIVAVNHKEYLPLNEAWFQSMLSPGGFVCDIKGIYRPGFSSVGYWSL